MTQKERQKERYANDEVFRQYMKDKSKERMARIKSDAYMHRIYKEKKRNYMREYMRKRKQKQLIK